MCRRIALIVVLFSFFMTGCGPDPFFVPVISISGVPDSGRTNIPLSITAKVNPGFATNRSIAWSVEDTGDTGAELKGNTLNTHSGGIVILRAKITNGKSERKDYIEFFTISIISGKYYTVTFNSNGGSNIPSETVGDGGLLNKPDDPSVLLTAGLYPGTPGHTFIGWYKEKDLNIPWDFENDTVTSDITLYAKWNYSSPIGLSSTNGNNIVEKAVNYVNNNANAGFYTLLVDENVNCVPQTLSASALTIQGLNGERKINLNSTSTGALFTVGNGTSLTLGENITLTGRTGNTSALVVVNANAHFTMLPGSRINGNTNTTIGTTIGGGVYVNGGTFTMNGNSIISGNTASYGGGVYVDGGTFEMTGNSSIQDNRANTGGGVFVGNGGTFTMNGGEISGNITNGYSGLGNVVGSGGGVFVNTDGTFIMNGGEISGNNASLGGGVCVYNGTFTMSGGTIGGSGQDGNSAIRGGGVQLHTNGTFIMSGGSISGNSAIKDDSSNTTGSGGGVQLHTNGTFDMKGGIISGNTASDDGGGVYMYGVQSASGTFTMYGGTISGNTANNNGGGVYMYGIQGASVTFTMYGGTISGNSANNNGGGVNVSSGTFHIVTGTIYGKDDPALKNNAVNGEVLYSPETIAQYGSGTTWNDLITNSSIYFINDTIEVLNGTLIRPKQ